MFRAAAPGPFDEAVAKATDENSTSEDWGAIMEVCDRVSADATNAPKEAVQSLIKRLAHRNANVQIYTLELANSLSQNCGTPLHRELSSRAFTDALLKLANDRNTHNVVRLKIIERMKEWTDMFRSNTDLGIMQDAYARLQQSQPQLQPPPSAPQKNSLTDLDRQREEEDLQRALKLSLEDETSKKTSAAGAPKASGSGAAYGSAAAAAAGSGSASSGPSKSAAGVTAELSSSAAPASAPPPQGTTAATVSRVRALFDFAASEPDELDFKKGDVIAVLESVYRDWWRGSLKGRTGIFPLNYVEILADPTPDELQREAQMEAEVFAEIKNVEKLLTLLSASNMAPREEDNDEISKLYHQTLAIRPKLIKLIEKYSQKKDDFTQLNEKFIKARRDYESLLESSMAHPPQHSYQQYAMRPQMPQQGYGPGPSGYGAAGGAVDQRYYTPAEPIQYSQSPPPNMQRPAGIASPFYIATNAGQAPQQQQQQQQQQPQQQHQPQQPQQPQQQQSAIQHAQRPQQPHQQPQQQQPPYPSASSQGRIPSGSGPSGAPLNSGRQPSPLQTNFASPPPANTYLPYNPQQQQQQQQQPQQQQQQQQQQQPVSMPGGPQSTYGNPQELSTSVYDSPVVAHAGGHDPASAATYSSSVYSVDQFASADGRSSSSPAPDPLHLPNAYPGYTTYPQQAMQAPQAPSAAAPSAPSAPSAPAPSAPSAPSAPPVPLGAAPQPAAPTSSPPPAPAAASGHYYDARMTLPSMSGSAVPAALSVPSGAPSTAAPSAPAVPGSAPTDQPQYRPYVPPSTVGASVDDFYRQAGRVGY